MTWQAHPVVEELQSQRWFSEVDSVSMRRLLTSMTMICALMMGGCSSTVFIEADLVPPGGAPPGRCLGQYKIDFMMMSDAVEKAEARREVGDCVRRHEAQGYKAKLPWN